MTMTTTSEVDRPMSDASPSEAGHPGLSPREREVLLAWLGSESKTDVARSLFISSGTVNTHLDRIRTKYAATGRPAVTKSALLVRALQDGLIHIDEL